MATKVLSSGTQYSTLPHKYIRPESERPKLSEVATCDDVPVIDLGCGDRSLIVRQIGDACRHYGFFQVINHGVAKKVIEEMLKVAHEFFNLSVEEKMKLYSDDPSKTMRLSTSFNVKKETVHDWRDYLRLHCYPLDKYATEWPSDLPSFRGAGDNKLSPLHPRFEGASLDSPTEKLDDGKSECHRLPLPPSSPTSPSALPNPRTCVTESSSDNLSKWKKGKLLGRGAFGHVYLGFNSENGQMCAIKEVGVVADDQTSKECLKQLNQEITLLSRFSHPNIVQYYGSELGEEALSLYLEFVSRGSIRKLLKEYGPFKEPDIQNYTRQILSGLEYLHANNTVHRDIKAANILVGPNGEIKLADFGVAKHINSSSSTLSFKGSPYWMAPEVVKNTNGYSFAVDIWSLGCTIIEMATSRPPWSQYDWAAAIFKIGSSKDMPEIPDNLSNDAKSFIRLCLQRDPSARPTAAQLLDHPFTK